MSQTLQIEDYIAQTQKYRESYFQLYGNKPTLGDFLAMSYNQQILAISEKLQGRPASDELVSDYLAWVPREQWIIDNYNEKNIPFSGSWSPGGAAIVQLETYTVSTVAECIKVIKVGMEVAFLNGGSRICGYVESVDDQKRWAYLLNCVEYDYSGQSAESFLKNAVASISDHDNAYIANINGTAPSMDMSHVAFLRKGTCRAVFLRTTDYVNPDSSHISGYHHTFSMIDSANFDQAHRY